MNNDIKKNTNSLWLKILIPILIIAVIAGIYSFKNMGEENQDTQDNSDKEGLALEISSVDLEEIKSYGLPFVIDFGSDSCEPCKDMAPVLETLHEEWQGKVIVHFVDVWKHTAAAKDFPVSLIPTQVFYDAQGNPFVPSDELMKEIEFTMYKTKDTKEHIFTVHEGGVTEAQMKKIFAEMGVK